MERQEQSTTDAEIMKLLRDNDQSALTIILKQVVPQIWPLIKRRFRDSLSDEDLEEVMAYALEKLWKNRGGFDLKKGDLNGWFYVIARNVAFDILRKKKPKSHDKLVLQSVESMQKISSGQNEFQEVVFHILANLSDREREVVNPLFGPDYVSAKDLGQKLNASEGAIRALRFRTLQKLRCEFAKIGFRIIREKVIQG